MRANARLRSIERQRSRPHAAEHPQNHGNDDVQARAGTVT
jgi:hypothetical protein